MDVEDVIGQVLDEKYRIERELGRGGMGTVYLATHLGTERPVAIKIIAPQFMARPEFVERFRREARAAGRLRHPNVVNVTDFGFALVPNGQVAYLVMEYLDGCTLGEILEEEKNLPVAWTLNILEQVCSAVHEAHEQGIIHRDLKPDNIWLEPNQRGGYTVKVLDFGIAKLEETSAADSGEFPALPTTPTYFSSAKSTMADAGSAGTLHDSISSTRVSEAATVAQIAKDASPNGDNETLIQSAVGGEDRGTLLIRPVPDANSDEDAVHTKLITAEGENTASASHGGAKSFMLSSDATSELTRVGAVLGTPLYMSPEQCRGDKLDARSDIYSLGVIGYQMLSGSTPFSGDFTDVMRSHKDDPPPPLNAKKVRKKLKQVISSALEKDPNLRPQSAEAFASTLIARSEGIFGLLRRAGTIYAEHIGKFLLMALLLFTPSILATFLNVGASLFFISEENQSWNSLSFKIILTTLSTFAAFFCGYLMVGTTTWLVNQILAVPLRPVLLRPALKATQKNWKALVGTGVLSTLLTFLGYALCLFPGVVLSVLLALVAPVVMMENLRGFAAMKRSKMLVMRSLRTTTAAVAILFFVPMMIGGATGFFVAVTVKAFSEEDRKSAAETAAVDKKKTTDAARAVSQTKENGGGDFNIDISSDDGIKVSDTTERNSMGGRVRQAIREGLTAILMVPVQIILTSLSSIIIALLYLKTRQAAGESLQDLFAQFAESDEPRKKWQERVRQRLMQSGRTTNRT